MTQLHDRFSAAIELGTRLDLDWTSLERRIRDTVPDLKATAYDTDSPGRPAWCEEHERPVTVCERHDLLCEGEPDTGHNDPTGTAAVENHSWDDALAYAKAARAVCHAIDTMVRIAGRYKIAHPNEVALLEQENAKLDGCEVCARSDKWVPVHVEKANPEGVLRKPVAACRWHFDFLSLHGRLPDEREEAIHQAGGRVTVRTKQVDRLRRGIKTGAL